MIVAKTILSACLKTEDLVNSEELFGKNELAFGNFSSGRFAWALYGTEKIEPIPAKGRLGLWNFDWSGR